MSSLRNWVWISECINYKNFSRVLEKFRTPENIMTADRDRLLTSISPNEADKILLKDFSKADKILEDCYNKNITIFSIQDSIYPDNLRNIENPPLVLYMKGKLPNLEKKPAINIIGTRKATLYGKMVTKKIAFSLAKEDMIIVSGLAIGIDAIANQSAILAGKPTIAVMGCSVDYIYPAENRRLIDDIIAVGALISEFPPTTQPHPSNFPRRNRIMSGISNGTLVVEAPRKSGTLITANYALDQGRDVFAVPGNIDNPNSKGCNDLLKIGAKMVTCAYDVIEEYEHLFEKIENIGTLKSEFNVHIIDKDVKENIKKNQEVLEKPKPEKITKRQNMTPQESLIYDIIENGAETTDEIVVKSNLKTSQVMSIVTMLEIYGDIQRIGNRIKTKEN